MMVRRPKQSGTQKKQGATAPDHRAGSGFFFRRRAALSSALLSLLVMLGASGCNTVTKVESSQSEHPEEANPFAAQKINYPTPGPVLGLIDSRKATSLNGQWKMIIDPMSGGDPAGGFFGGFPPNKQSKTGMELIEYNFETADSVRVPGDWNSQKESLFFYRGSVWYYRKFDAPASNTSRKHLSFGGANFTAQIFLNGEVIGEHKGGYVPFSFDVTDKLKAGENVLVIHVNNQLTADTVPTLRTDWWPYGGLTRDVALVETPEAFIRNAKIALLDHSTGRIAVELTSSGFEPGAEARVSIPELGVDKFVRVGSSGEAALEFTANPTLWSPENPKLYTVTFSLGEDKLSDRVGFRTIATKGRQILLNGEPVKLRGISTHEEPIGVPGAAYSRSHYRKILQEAKALNANFVRAAHYPYSRHIAKAADELGVMLWEEVPVYWNIAWENPETLAIARDQMERLVTRDWNRASVIIWSVANETPLSGPRMVFLKRMIDDVREMDSTRLVSAALLGGGRKSFSEIITHLAVRALDKGNLAPGDEAIAKAILERSGDAAPGPDDKYVHVIDDPLSELVDVVAYNEYFGWYYSVFFSDQTGIGEAVLRPLMLDFMSDVTIVATVDKPIHISEYGAGAKAGRKGGAARIWTEEYQAAVYKAQIGMLRNSPQVQGMTPWILKDFRAMLRTLPGVQDYYNRKGLIDENGNRKLAFEVLADFYAGPWESDTTEAMDSR